MSLGEILAKLLPGAWTTIELTAVVWPISLALAIVIALVRVYRVPVVAQIAAAYVDVMRSIPVLLLLFYVFFGFPFIGVRLTSLTTAVVCLVLNFTAFQAETVRASILSVPTGYLDAGRVLGMGRFLLMRRVVSPLALRVALPPFANSVIDLFKGTAVVSLVAVHDIVFVGNDVANQTFDALPIYGLITLFYISVGFPSIRFFRWLERKTRLPETFQAGAV